MESRSVQLPPQRKEKTWVGKKLSQLRGLWKLDKPRALAYEGFGNAEGEYTWQDWERDTKAKYPIRYFLQETFPSWLRYEVAYPMSRLRYWIMSRWIRKDHLLDLRGPDYSYGLLDSSEQIIRAAFTALKNHVERNSAELDFLRQEGEEWVDEVRTLHAWWEVRSTHTWDQPREGETQVEGGAALIRLSEDREKEDDEMLARLAKIRLYLWT